MGTDALGYVLAILVIGMTMVSVRQRNILLYIGTAGLWATLMAFILANTVAGTNWQSMFILSAFTFMAAMVILIAVSRRASGVGGSRTGDIIGRAEEEEVAGNPMGIGLEDIESYRRRVRKALHPNRRKR